VLAFDGMSAFELGIVTEVFGLPRPSSMWTGTT
jgi:AraC family transcriptional activator FtrA